MGQMTIYLDRDIEARAKAEAKARGVSVSRWVTELIRKQAQPGVAANVSDSASR